MQKGSTADLGLRLHLASLLAVPIVPSAFVSESFGRRHGDEVPGVAEDPRADLQMHAEPTSTWSVLRQAARTQLARPLARQRQFDKLVEIESADRAHATEHALG